MRTRPHIMLRSIIRAAFGLVITLPLVDPCAGQQNVTAPNGAAAGRDFRDNVINVYNYPEPSHSTNKNISNNPEPLHSPNKNISGRWRDDLGTVYQIDQLGTQFSFTAEGNWVSPPIGSLCRGPFQSGGHGTIAGDIATSTYRTTSGTTGNCSTTISESRMNCTDTMCGSFSVYLSRQ
jgi:hypothetical protein